jgi:hypothetical protein
VIKKKKQINKPPYNIKIENLWNEISLLRCEKHELENRVERLKKLVGALIWALDMTGGLIDEQSTPYTSK